MSSSAAAGATRARRSGLLTLISPAGYLGLFVAVPLLLVLVSAFLTRGRVGGVRLPISVDSFVLLAEPVYLGILLTSLATSLTVTLVCVVVAYAFVAAMRGMSPRGRAGLLVVLMVPFWTSFLIRAYAWMLLLGEHGPVNAPLLSLGVIEQPLTLLYTPASVTVVLVYVYLPMMILPIAAAAESVDPTLRDAARNLGAGAWRRFRTIDLPLTLPGCLTGCVLVLVPSMSNFVVPDLIGGGKTVLIGNVIQDEFLVSRNWPFGSVLALTLIALLVGVLVVQAAVSRRFEGHAR